MTITDPAPTDLAETEAFIGQLFGWLIGTAATSLIAVGERAGLLDALASGPATSVELAERSGLSERHVREWLGGIAVAGIADHDESTGRFSLRASRAAALVGPAPSNVAPLASAMTYLLRFAPAVVRTLSEGGGIPYSEYQPEFGVLGDGINRRIFDAGLVDGYVGAAAGIVDRLRAGITALDVGCGTGHVSNLLARAFPASTFTGYDIAEDGLARARDEAASWGLTNVRFERVDVANFPIGTRFDLITAFDAIHDQARPRRVLRQIHDALAPGGTFLMVDMNASSSVHANIGNPIAPYFYWVSLFHCMQVSLAEGGEGLGTAWGVELATELLHDAGFTTVERVPAPPTDPVNAIFVATP
jgi:SAM-dependent methyltransferase